MPKERDCKGDKDQGRKEKNLERTIQGYLTKVRTLLSMEGAGLTAGFVPLKVQHRGSGGALQLVRCLLCKHKDLSWIPRTHVLK